MDQRIEKLAHLLVNYSCRLQEGEKILIDYEGSEVKPLIRQLIKETYKESIEVCEHLGLALIPCL